MMEKTIRNAYFKGDDIKEMFTMMEKTIKMKTLLKIA